MRRGFFAMGAALAALFLLNVAAGAAAFDGKKVFTEKKCAGCHQTKGPAREKTIKDQLAKKAPELWYAGSKFKPGFLEKWLADPQPIRPMKYYSLTEKNPADHPRLERAQALAVAAYLMGLKSGAVKPGSVQAQDNPRGRVIFLKKQSCYGCHQVRQGDAIVGGLTGPSLVGASNRLTPEWIYAYLSNPKVFKPVKDMPNYEGILSDEEIKPLAAFVAAFN